MDCYEIKSEKFKVVINAKGAELASLVELKSGYEFIWQAKPEVWARHAPVLFPIVGKLKDNSIEINNKIYRLNQHGFARDLNFTLQDISENRIVFELTDSHETREWWPFGFKLTISYNLRQTGLKIEYIVKNTGNDKLPFSIGAHPGFALPSSNLNEYEIWHSYGKVLSRIHLSDGLLGKEESKIGSTQNIVLSSDIFKNDALIFKNIEDGWFSLKHLHSDYSVKLTHENFCNFGIWAKHPNQEFICLEPWYGITDAVGSTGKIEHKSDLKWLDADEVSNFTYVIDFTNP